MKYRNRLITAAAILLVAANVSAQPFYGADVGTSYFNGAWDRSQALEICHIIKTKSTALALYGFHVANTSGSKVYACLFDGTAQPSNGVVAPGGCWDINANTAIDVALTQGSVGFNSGIALCLSTTDATYTATTAVGLMWPLYRGPGVTSTPTPTAVAATSTATPSPSQVPTSTPKITNTPTATPTSAFPTDSATPTATPTKTPTPTATP